jgi:molybdate transport system regulatory protein
MAGPRVSLRIDLPNGARLGPGKIALLEAIDQRTSISAAARELSMSYRRAWLLVDDLNRGFATPLVRTSPGRAHGGGALLTAFGKDVVASYRRAERSAERATVTALTLVIRHLDDSYAPPSRELTGDG